MLSIAEEEAVLATLDGERFADKAPAEVYATLLDEGAYFCSISTMYRLLHRNGQVHERRNQLRHPSYAKPELLATGPDHRSRAPSRGTISICTSSWTCTAATSSVG